MQTSTNKFNVYKAVLITDIVEGTVTKRSPIYEIIEEKNGFSYNNKVYFNLEDAQKDCKILNGGRTLIPH